MLASDVNNPEFVGAVNPDAATVAEFYNKSVKQPFMSDKEGRPKHALVAYVKIWTPGNQLSIVDTPMREEHKRRFPLQWQHFQNTHGGDAREIGTPLSSWPFLDVAQVEDLRGLKFFTVESLANASDLNINNIGMIGGMNPMVLRERAKAYLQAAAGAAPSEKQAGELAQAKIMIEELQKQVQALMAGMAGAAGVLAGTPAVPEAPALRKRRTKAEMQLARVTASAIAESPATVPQIDSGEAL